MIIDLRDEVDVRDMIGQPARVFFETGMNASTDEVSPQLGHGRLSERRVEQGARNSESTMQVFWKCRSLSLAAVLTALTASAGYGQTVNVERVADEVRQAILNADAAATPAERMTALEAAAYSLGVLERSRSSADRDAQEKAAVR